MARHRREQHSNHIDQGPVARASAREALPQTFRLNHRNVPVFMLGAAFFAGIGCYFLWLIHAGQSTGREGWFMFGGYLGIAALLVYICSDHWATVTVGQDALRRQGLLWTREIRWEEVTKAKRTSAHYRYIGRVETLRVHAGWWRSIAIESRFEEFYRVVSMVEARLEQRGLEIKRPRQFMH